MAHLTRLAVALVALLPCLTASANAGAAMPATAGHDLLLLRAGAGAQATLLTQSMAGGRTLAHLPLGLADQAASALYVAGPASADAAGNPRSLLRALDITSGRTMRSLLVPGRYSTQTEDYSAATLAHNGRWLALRAAGGTAVTQALVVDTAAMRVVATVRLPGHFGLDAIDPDGKVLYLIQHLSGPGPDAYRVRSYQIRTGNLDPKPVLEKEDTTGTMSGVAWTRAWSPGGEWLFTLYVHPGHGGAFIHALGVEYRLAQCIDLPLTAATADALAHYALVVSPDGKALYAVNPPLGQVEVMRDGLPFGRLEGAGLGLRAGSPRRPLNDATITPDGLTIFVGTDRGLWAIDTPTLQLRAVYLRGQRVTSVALSRDGRRLYALEPDRARIMAINPAGGQLVGQVAAPAGAWAMEQLASRP